MEKNKDLCICNRCGHSLDDSKKEFLILCPHCKQIKKVRKANLIDG